MTERTFQLEQIEDLRELDIDTGKRFPLAAGEGNECDRCGREHAVVWTVRETTPGAQRVFKVGSSCGPKILDGWSPEKSEIRKARKADKQRALRAAWAKRLEPVQAIALDVAAVELPATERVPNEWRDDLDVIRLEGIPRVAETVDKGAPVTDVVLSRLRSKLVAHRALEAGHDHCETAWAGAFARGATMDQVLDQKGLKADG